MSTPSARSWLYVPAVRPDLLRKAMEGAADAVVLDLEDAVPHQRKQEARANTVAAVRQTWPKPLWVRINPPHLPAGEEDIAALAGTPVQGVRVPKSENPTELRRLAHRLDVPLHLLLETALGVERAYELATAAPQVRLLSLGEADLAADLRVTDDADDGGTLDWARGRLVHAARAARLPGPVQSVWTAVHDIDGLTTSTRRAHNRGFYGRSVVHPSQIPPVHRVFTPSDEEIDEARRLVDSLQRASDQGSGAWLDAHGRLVDPAVVARAHWLLEHVA
ncbi:HpcH/HpaI aldolase/citrate lyase family protein [Streptomyces xiaopingdaonensis]|uniref:HpcH/HpaI aldolase/citrate lyase family protein n=1 Tax=Streptomyces xiaopingdaonensis TaxID=1565415 RepID=UPI000311F8FB|nr:CoA ester lyase [Streptomyces xiaopingdaonensis]